jgi:zinc carboxypeptidase
VRLLALLSLSLLLAGSAASGTGARKVVVGRSLEGRPIVAYELGDSAIRRKVLVVGCIHGNESAGIAILDRLRRLGSLAGTDLWLVPDTNPDGHAAGTRGNARGVDLNRNFLWRWRPLSGAYYPGAAPASGSDPSRHEPDWAPAPDGHDLVPPALEHGRPHRRESRAPAPVRPSCEAEGWAAAALPRHRDQLVERHASRHDRVRGRASVGPSLPARDRAPRQRGSSGFH